MKGEAFMLEVRDEVITMKSCGLICGDLRFFLSLVDLKKFALFAVCLKTATCIPSERGL